MEQQFLNKDITIRKIDSSYARGICVNENDSGLTIQIEYTQKIVFVPLRQISEVVSSKKGD
jgi:hypothetical protein